MADTLYDRLKEAVDDIRRNGVDGVRFPDIRMGQVVNEADKDTVVHVSEVNPSRPWEEGGDWNEFCEFDESGAIEAALAQLRAAAGDGVESTFRIGCHEAEFVRTAAFAMAPAVQNEPLEFTAAQTATPQPIKKARRHLDAYDGFGLDDKVAAVLDEYDVREEFYDWLDGWLALNANFTLDDGPDLPCVFRIEGSENPLDPKPYVTLALKATTDTVSGYSTRNGYFDVTTLNVELVHKYVIPNVSERIVSLLRQATAPLTAEAIATALQVKKHRVNSALVSLMIPERVEEVPLPDNPRLSGWKLQRGA